MGEGKLTKLIIQSFEDSATDKKSDEYKVLINPDQIVYDFKVKHVAPNPNNANEQQFIKYESDNLSLKLLFDGTGIIGTSTDPFTSGLNMLASGIGGKKEDENDVEAQIQKFMDVVHLYKGKEHQQHKVKIFWGEHSFEGFLKSFKVTHTLFKPDGTSIRATGDAVFSKSLDPNTARRDNNPTSPDLTHIRIVKQGDTLPLMCDQIYKNSKYYLEIAKVNGLSNYRKLEVGSKIFFPPIKEVV